MSELGGRFPKEYHGSIMRDRTRWMPWNGVGYAMRYACLWYAG